LSHFIRIQAKFKDASALCVALQAMGFAKEQIERHETAQRLSSRYSDQAYAEIIVRRTVQHGDHRSQSAVMTDMSPVGAPARIAPPLSVGDMGFKLNAEGEYECVMESMDRHLVPESWFDTLKQEYTAELTRREYALQGFSVQRSNLADGKVQLAIQGF
jgi:Protein of unknown function (DUF1257)